MGQIKFLSDGLLAIFPFGDGQALAEEVCEAAVVAAELALSETADINANRAANGEPALELGIALHAGEVVYGNVGASRRLDFTITGSTVNEASRMQGLCSQLGRSLLLSNAFAKLCGRATTSLGAFGLRGLESRRMDELSGEGRAMPANR
jgi:adenylate cyclase